MSKTKKTTMKIATLFIGTEIFWDEAIRGVWNWFKRV